MAPGKSDNKARERDGLYETVIRAIAQSDKYPILKQDIKRLSKGGEELKQLYHDEEQKQERMHPKRGHMGHYIFNAKKGERPLTFRDLPTPGPADYNPDYSKTSSFKNEPEYSIRPMIATDATKQRVPGPKYITTKGMFQHCSQKVTMKGRSRPPIAKEGEIGPGPGAYLVPNNAVGSQPKHTLPTMKRKTKYSTGIWPSLALPEESPGFTVVEERLMIDQNEKSCKFGDAPKWTMAGRLTRPERHEPGPSHYDRPVDYHKNPQPGKSFAGRLLPRQDEKKENTPGPNNYTVSLKDKPREPRAVIIPRRDHNPGIDAPAPNEYAVRGAYDKQQRIYDWRGPNITFRGNYAGEVQPEKLPGPSDYRPYRDKQVPGGSFGLRSKTSYPECLQYKQHLNVTQIIPGAATYSPNNHCITKNSGPKYSFSGAGRKKGQGDAAGPGDYNIRGLTNKGFSPGAKYSLGVPHFHPKEVTDGVFPAPCDYDLEVAEKGRGFTMTGRNSKPNISARKPKRGVKSPGPKYNVGGVTKTGPLSCGAKGVILKSRHSPHVYAGAMQESKLLSKQPLDTKWENHISLG